MRGNKIAMLMALASMMSGIAHDEINYKTEKSKEPESTDHFNKRMSKKGMKRFMIDGFEIWALNEKSANKKYRKLTNKK